jgi:hypothetical protein
MPQQGLLQIYLRASLALVVFVAQLVKVRDWMQAVEVKVLR